MTGVGKIEELERNSGAPVELRVIADADQLPVVRAVAETLAVLGDFTLDDIADIKLAVDEVCSQLIAGAVPSAELTCSFVVGESGMQITTTSVVHEGRVPKSDSFGWHVLQTLTDSISLSASSVPNGSSVAVEEQQLVPVPYEKSTRRQSDDYSEVVPLIQQMQTLDADSPERQVLRDRIITRCLPLAEHIARRFGGRGEAHEDLLQVARLGLVNAVDRFDIERGSDFVSFAVPTIMGEARRYFRDAGWSVRVPRRMKELNSLISGAVGTLSQKLGRAPTASEIAAELGIDVKEASQALLARSAYQTVSVDSVVSDDRLPLMDTLGANDPELEKMESYLTVRPALEKLPERERQIVILRFFGSMTQTQIADRMGISQMHVSRILSRTLIQLREELGQG